MTEFSNTSPISTLNHVSPNQERVKCLWLDIALVIGAIGLAAIALLTQLGIVHPCFHLPHVGTLSSQFVEYVTGFGSLALVLIEACKLLYQHRKSAKAAKPTDPIRSNKLNETIIEISKETATNPIETTTPPSVTKEPVFALEKAEINENRALLYGKLPNIPSSFTVDEMKFEIANQDVTLYGVYPKDLEGVKTQIIEKLQALKSPDPKKIEDILTLHRDIGLALEVKNDLYISAKKYMIVFENNNREMVCIEEETFQSTIINNKKQFIILGLPTTLAAISKKAEKILGEENPMNKLATLLLNEAKDNEIGFILLNKGPKFRLKTWMINAIEAQAKAHKTKSRAKALRTDALPREHSFELSGQKVTLYGMYSFQSSDEENIVKRLREHNSLNLDDLKNTLNQFKCDVALDLGKSVIISARNYIYYGMIHGKYGFLKQIGSETHQKISGHFNKSPKSALILGSPKILATISKKFKATINDANQIDKERQVLEEIAKKEKASENSLNFIDLV